MNNTTTMTDDYLTPLVTRQVSAPQVCAITGVSYRQLDYWCRLGVITPAVPAVGCGTQRAFDVAQIPVLRCLGQLAASGAGADQLRSAFEALEALPPNEWRGHLYVSPSGRVSTRMQGPVALALNLEHTRAERVAYCRGDLA